MRSAAQLSELIGNIYDASLAPDRWPEALAGACAYVGGAAAMIFQHDSLFLEGCRLSSWGDDPRYTDLYFSQYIDLNPSARIQLDIPDGKAVSVSGLIGEVVLRDTPFFREWMEPQGYVDNVFANLHRTATRSAAIAVSRGRRDGLVTQAALRRMQDIVPHVQRAVIIGNLIDRGQSDLQVMQKLVDEISACVLLVDGTGTIKRANTIDGRHEADCELVWRSSDGRYRLDRRLDAELGRFTRQMAESVDVRSRRHDFSLPGHDGRDWLVHLRWLREGGTHSDLKGVHEAVAAIFVHQAQFNSGAALQIMARRYSLTPREVDIVRSLVGGGGMSAVAGREGITTRTAKAHLHSVFAKTGTARQADLVALVARYSGLT